MSTSATDYGTAVHPTYATWAPVWRWLGYVVEGSGPFLNGGAIIPHPREWLDHSITSQVRESEVNADGVTVYGELRTVSRINPNPKQPSPKLQERRRLARYENVASPIIDHKLAALLRNPPTRRVKGVKQEHDWLTWTTTDVDGAGTNMDDFMRDAERIALIFGHAIVLADRVGGAEAPATLAEQGRIALRLYAPIDMPDWRQDETGALAEVKLLEIVPRTSLRGQNPGRTAVRVRYVDGETFEVVDETKVGAATQSASVRTGSHGFGRLPCVVLYAKRRALTPLIGQSVLYDPMMHVDLHNMGSEVRELMRKQVFSILNVPLGTGADAMAVDHAKALIGETTGTANVLFSGQPAQFLTADTANVTVYLECMRQLLRTIYRLANVPFESDSKDAEAMGSLKLKREDMNQVLASYASEMQRSEEAIAELWFRGTYGPQGWEAEWDKAQPSIAYPDTFDVTPFAEILDQASAALALPLGGSKTFMLELGKEMAPRLLTNATPETLQTIFTELESVPTPREEREQRMAALATRFKDGPPAPGTGEIPDEDPAGVAPV